MSLPNWFDPEDLAVPCRTCERLVSKDAIWCCKLCSLGRPAHSIRCEAAHDAWLAYNAEATA